MIDTLTPWSTVAGRRRQVTSPNGVPADPSTMGLRGDKCRNYPSQLHDRPANSMICPALALRWR
jgi:hypothetical protein